MKTKMTPIVSWSIWAGGLSLVMAIITRNQLIAGFRSDETGMSFVITALFMAGLVVSFRAARQLHQEWAVLAKINKTNVIPKSTYSADLASVFSKLQGFKDQGENVDIHTAIDTYHAKHNSRVRSVSIMAALVISMGLLGTVVGLIMSISGLSSMVENIGLSRTTMMNALTATVAGMGTAFYTTFFGALGGLILRAVAVSQLNSLSELCSEAAEYADNHLTIKLESNEAALNEQISKVISTFENMQHEMDALTGRISESIETTMAKFGESIEAVGQHAMDSTKTAVTGMTDQMGAFGTTIEESFGSYNEMIVKAGEETHDAIKVVNENIEKSGDELHETFSGLYDIIGTAGEGVTETFEGLNGTIAEAGEKVTDAFDSLNGSVHQASESVSGSLVDFKLSIDGTAIDLNDAVSELHTAISEATGEMVTMNKAKFDAEASQIAGHLSSAATSIQQFLQHKNAAADTADESTQKVA
ncbi:MotA/TolQ/ExbB proton channel family protein [Pontiellaceae bacterium B1224]|nr:MotA/TolQ/ExbB proton channel family protein [Pontiellaceae bacterium B1224]